ncbi:MAG: hypothetical protein JNL90_15160 [Planctomycetes bacterium]|nr:hypothetical protein [Planctomycetota bacterium]
MRAAPRRAAALLAAALFGCSRGEEAAPAAGRTPAPLPDETSLLDAPLERPQRGDTASALVLYRQARAALDRDELDGAQSLFEAALQADPALNLARNDLGFLLLERAGRGAFGEALRHFRLARLAAADDALAACGEGLARRELGDLERARPLLEFALRDLAVSAEPGRGTLARAALASIAAAQGDVEGALAGYADALERAPLPPGTAAHFRLARAELLQERGALEAAASEVEQALQLAPEEPRGHLLMAQLAARRGDGERAAVERRRHELLRALQDHTALRFRRDAARTLELRRALVAEWPDHLGGVVALAEELLAQRQHADALQVVAAARATRGALPLLIVLAARAHAGAGDLAAARQVFAALPPCGPAERLAAVRLVLAQWQRDQGKSAAELARELAAWSEP